LISIIVPYNYTISIDQGNLLEQQVDYTSTLSATVKNGTEIVNGMDKGILLLNGNDKNLKKVKPLKDIDIIKITSHDFEITNIKESIKGLEFDLNKYNKHVTFSLPGIHFIDNIILAIKIGLMFEVPIDDIIEAISSYQTLDKRMHVYSLDQNITLIDDCYNASYESVVAGFNIISKENQRKIIILGDSLELGKYSKYIHKKIGFKIKRMDNTILLAVGTEVKHIENMHLKNAHFFDSNNDLIKYLAMNNLIESNDLIYIKGSRRMKLEMIRDYLINKLATNNLE
jgi:UDP-N-acetylmuramyl pentapeptide synthase